jgi:hypothetical protein
MTESFRFSGHDTFHCREQWILKGIQLVQRQGDTFIFKQDEAIPLLGVGKNMVRSIHHWLKAFGILNDKDTFSKNAKLLFFPNGLDPYLENDGSLWILQYLICKTRHASINNLIFSGYFADKATLEFSENQILNYVNKLLREMDQKEVAAKTFNSDFKVFIKTYVSPIKNEKTIEDDFNAPLLSLNLVNKTGRKNGDNQTVYRLNRGLQESITEEVFAYCLLTEFHYETSISFDNIRIKVGAFLCLSNEGLEILINRLCKKHPQFVYKSDGGIRQLSIKKSSQEFKNNLLSKHYGAE